VPHFVAVVWKKLCPCDVYKWEGQREREREEFVGGSCVASSL
jgi:hypothetical protein